MRNQNNPEMLSKLDSFAPGALLVDKGGFATGAVALNWIARFGGWGCGGSVGDSTAALQLRYGRKTAEGNKGKMVEGSERLCTASVARAASRLACATFGDSGRADRLVRLHINYLLKYLL